MKLGTDVFLALSAIIWADGKVTPEEAEGLTRAARASGITGPDLARIERATKERLRFDAIHAGALGRDERLFVYGIATWLTQVDGHVDPREEAMLEELAGLLGLSDADRQGVALASSSVARAATSEADVLALAKAIETSAQEDSPQRR